MSRLKTINQNVRSLVAEDYVARRQAEEKRAEVLGERLDAAERRLDTLGEELGQRLAAFEEKLEKRADEFEGATNARLDGYESAVDARIEERFASVERTLEARLTSIESRMDVVEQRLDERLDELTERIDGRLGNYEAAVDERLETRMDSYEASVDERLEAYMNAADERMEGYTLSVDERFEEYTRAVDARADERLAQIERRSDERLARHTKEVNKAFAKLRSEVEDRFDQRARALDTRTDDRLMNLERNIEHRLTAYEKGLDERLTARERFVDGVLESNRKDLVERTDIMLQAIEQRQDKLRVLLKSAAGRPPSVGAPPQELLPALPKFADITAAPPSLNGGHASATLLDRIIEWKKHSAAGLSEFTPDEQEIVDYLLSFISDPGDEAYVRLHMRRFLATLQRIPPAQRTSARALELGSYVQLTPAIRKYAGYSVVKCADLWDGPEKVEQVELVRRDGGETLHFELRNFDAEREPFPYPDKHFQLVLCCEMLEHLSHDPMHTLWEANRVLEDGGYLLVTTPNITSARAIEGLLTGYAPYLMSQYNVEYPPGQHHREYAPREIRLALEAAGFAVLELETEDVWLRSNPAILELLESLQMSTAERGDNIFALGRKTSAPVERYPKELYVMEGEKTAA
jgi:SAM-dependent methyltransferase/DNA anti-recombination protein RmuC